MASLDVEDSARDAMGVCFDSNQQGFNGALVVMARSRTGGVQSVVNILGYVAERYELAIIAPRSSKETYGFQATSQ
jgi:hypothetical protein